MRKQIRTKLLATCMAAIAVVTMTACKSQPTHAFTPAPEPEPISESAGTPAVINNQGRFQYKLDEQKYNDLLKKASPAGYGTLTGHAVYVDGQGQLFIVSGFDKVVLEDGKIPESAWAGLRAEGSGTKIFVQSGANEAAEAEAVTRWVRAWESGTATVSAAKNGSYTGKVITINNRILDTRTGNVDPQFVDGVAYLPAVSVFGEAGNITMVEAEGDMVVFNVQSARGSGTERYVISMEDPNTVTSADGTASLSAETPLVYTVKGVLYVDPVAMADVFDWQVNAYGGILEGKKGLLDIVTDVTYAEGHAVAAYGCVIDEGTGTAVNPQDQATIDRMQEELTAQAEKTQKMLEGKQQELNVLREELSQNEGLSEEQIAQRLQERSDEIDKAIQEGKYEPGAGQQGQQGGQGQSQQAGQQQDQTQPAQSQPADTGGYSHPDGGPATPEELMEFFKQQGIDMRPSEGITITESHW